MESNARVKEHSETLSRLGAVSNPIEEAQNALRQLVFSMLIEDAVSSRTITRANLVQQLRVETGGPGVNVNVPFNDDQLQLPVGTKLSPISASAFRCWITR